MTPPLCTDCGRIIRGPQAIPQHDFRLWQLHPLAHFKEFIARGRSAVQDVDSYAQTQLAAADLRFFLDFFRFRLNLPRFLHPPAVSSYANVSEWLGARPRPHILRGAGRYG